MPPRYARADRLQVADAEPSCLGIRACLRPSQYGARTEDGETLLGHDHRLEPQVPELGHVVRELTDPQQQVLDRRVVDTGIT